MVARKGNRKVVLAISGLINQGVMGWDDGAESNAYVVTNDNQRSRFSFVGKAAINAMWEAGYAIDIGIRTANSKLVNQVADGGFTRRLSTGFDLRSSVWFLRNKHYGTVFVGMTFAATDRIANSNVTQAGMFDQYAAPENAGLGMFLRSATNGRLTNSLLNWRRIIGAGGDQPGESQRGFSLVKYVSPTWNGFTAAADWVVDRLLGRGVALPQGDRGLRCRRRHRLSAAHSGIAHAQRLPFRLPEPRRRYHLLPAATRIGQRPASRVRALCELRIGTDDRRPRR